MREAYSAKELAPVIGVTERAVQLRAKKEGWSAQQAGSGKDWKRLAYLAASLPEDVKAALAAAEAREAARLPAPRLAEAVVPDWSHRTGLDRYRVCAEFKSALARNPQAGRGETLATFLAAYNAGILLPEQYERLGEVKQATLYRWLKTLADNGDDYRALCDRRGKWTTGGAQGLGQVGPEAEKLFLAAYLTPNRPSVTLAAKAANVVLEKKGLETHSDQSFRRYLKRFDAAHHDLVVLMREGEKALKDKVGAYITRQAPATPGQALFADGHPLDFEILHPITGRAARLTLITWFDWASRMPVGWEIMPEEDTVAISSALRMAVANLGRYPDLVYIDNGRAFKSAYFTRTGSEIEDLDGLYARLGIAVQHSRPYEARTKDVERFFLTFGEQCERLMPSYCGASIADKPAWRLRNEKWHQARQSGYVPTIQEAAEIFRLFVGWYARQPHRGLGGRTPGEVLAAGRGPGVDLAELDRHFLFTAKKRPQRCRVTLSGVEFESDALYGLNQDVLVKYSWSDLSAVQLFDLAGRHLGEAKPVEAVHGLARHFGDELDMLALKEANARQRQLKSQTLRLAKELDRDVAETPLAEMPWMSREKVALAVVPKGRKALPETAAEPVLTAEEAADLTAAQAETQAAMAARPAYEAPFFRTPFERYDFLFDLSVLQGVSLTEDDAEFMASYEASEDFGPVALRFEQLRRAYRKPVAKGASAS